MMKLLYLHCCLWICVISSCQNSANYSLRDGKVKFKSVSPDTSRLFKDTQFRKQDYSESKDSYGYNISLLRLIVTPEVYHMKRVEVKGFLCFGVHETSLYVDKEDCINSISKNGVHLYLTEEDMDKVAELRDKYVIVNGTFDMKGQGHLGSMSGTLTDISEIAYFGNSEDEIFILKYPIKK